jgi:hypothetical protein
MVALALLAPIFWVAERRDRFQRLAEYHCARSSADIICCVQLVTDDGQKTNLVEGGTGLPTTLARAGWHRTLTEKYQAAARCPWWDVPPDTPRPQ